MNRREGENGRKRAGGAEQRWESWEGGRTGMSSTGVLGSVGGAAVGLPSQTRKSQNHLRDADSPGVPR